MGRALPPGASEQMTNKGVIKPVDFHRQQQVDLGRLLFIVWVRRGEAGRGITSSTFQEGRQCPTLNQGVIKCVDFHRSFSTVQPAGRSLGRAWHVSASQPFNNYVSFKFGGKNDRLFLDVERNISLKGGPLRGSRPRLAAGCPDEVIQLRSPLALIN